MNGLLTIKDEKTQQIINQPVFIPFIFLKPNNINSFTNPQIVLSNGSLIINNVSMLPQVPNNSKNDVLPCAKYVERDHNYCIPSKSCPTNNLPLGGEKERDKIDLLKSIDLTEKFTSPPLPVITSVTSLSGTSNDNRGKEMIKDDSKVVQQEPNELKLAEPQKQKRKYKSHRERKRCYRCNKDICASFMYWHLAKHRHDDRKKLELKKQRELKKEKKNLTCETCNGRFDTNEELLYHLSLHLPFICDKCGKGFAKRSSLTAHMIVHNSNKFICEVCGKGWKNNGSLQNHLQTHQSRSLKCELCSKMFTRKAKLKLHVRRIHQKRDTAQCSYCGKIFNNDYGLKAHVRVIHLNEKPYECHICHKKFSRREYLKNHKRCGVVEKDLNRPIKENGEPVPCKLCGKSFSILAAMKRHLLSHIRRYACNYCPLTFSSKALSQRHEKIHQDGEFFRCDVCWKRFESSEKLDEHSAKHKNAQYLCNMCGKAFNRRYLMNHHKLLDHINTSDQDEVKKVVIESLLEVENWNRN